MVTRRQLLREYADRFLETVNTPSIDLDTLQSLISKDLVTPLTYPGEKSGYVGVQGILKKLHGSLSNYSLKLLSPVIDEDENQVVFFVKSCGVQTGEWRGLPGSGKPFDHFGFVMMKVHF
jgi:hypothetical protein